MSHGVVHSFDISTRQGKISSFDYRSPISFRDDTRDWKPGAHVVFRASVIAVDVQPNRQPNPMVDDVPSDAANAAVGRFDADYQSQFGNREAIEAQQKSEPPAIPNIDCGTL